MFDVGFSEIVLTLLVAFLVLGPERLPEAGRKLGLFIRTVRQMFFEAKQGVLAEIEKNEQGQGHD